MHNETFVSALCVGTPTVITRWLTVGLSLLTLSLLTGACGGENPWTISPPSDRSCDIYKQLRDNTKYTQASAYDDPEKSKEYSRDPKLRSPYKDLMAKGRELACLTLFRVNVGDKPTVFQMAAVALTDQGEIKSLDPQTKKYDGPIRWKLSPVQLKGVSLKLGLFVLHPGQLGGKDHTQYCRDLFLRNPQCFPDNKNQKSDCWFWMRFKPKLPKDTPFSLEGNQGSCTICSREICGNNVDDDCDGQTDEGCGESDCHHEGSTIPCYKGPKQTQGVGLCKEGVRTCRKTVNSDNKQVLQWSRCEKQGLPQQEVCNGIDDNCDGQTDEGLKDCCIVGEVRACYSGDPKQAGQGICERGVEQCAYDDKSKGGKWSSCGGDTKPLKEVCDGKDNDCNGKIDDGLPTKDCQTKQPGECAAGQETCRNGIVECRPKKPPQQELCNLKDDDCDGLIDELFQERGQPCKVPGAQGPCAKGIKLSCKLGQVTCQALYQVNSVEICNDGIDNDCNGKTDQEDSACDCKAGEKRKCYPGSAQTRGKGNCKDGEQICQLSGKWGTCIGAIEPKTEVCDGKDNNCDGNVDETFPAKGQLCFIVTGGAQGPCTYGRLDSCGSSPNFKPVCKAVYKAKAAEVCNNGIDDDCDGVIDNSPPCDCRNKASNTQPCSKMPPSLWNKGICKAGTQTCNFNGVWSGCLGEAPAAIETCDGKDNDCNGKIDEADPKLNVACQVQSKNGECKKGTNKCRSGKLVCVATIIVPPQSDPCDGKDNDCNGKIDDSDPATGKVCGDPTRKGECSRGKLACVKGQWTCPATQTSQKETCNGKDDDCNGVIDDNLTAPSCKSSRQGVCAQATKLCGGTQGWLECQPGDFFRISTLYQEKETLCDGKDNDCDGQVDTDSQGKPLTRSCYADSNGKAGPAVTRKVGSCKEGQSTCSKGLWGACSNAILPTVIQCNDDDKNCNGKPDKEEPECRCADKLAQGELVIRTWGTGKDGSLLIKNRLILDSIAGKELDRTPKSNRSQPDITSHEVTAIHAQAITVKDASGLQAGDEILLIHRQGDSKRVGTYELLRILSLDKTKLNLTSKVLGIYGSKDNQSLGGQKVMALRVPQYRRVTIASGGTLTVSPWNGKTGGILVFRAQELFRVGAGGTASVAGLGYRGAAKVSGNTDVPKAGESIQGESSDGIGKDGAGHAAAKGTNAASGGGGSYGSAGKPGLQRNGKPAGAAGKEYGKPSLQQTLYLGSGGGAGAPDSSAKGADSKNETGAGGSAGGLIFVIARTLNVAGTISADGAAGGNAVSFGATLGGGGGGSGGSIHLRAYNLQIYTGSKLTAAGGKGGLSAANGPSNPTQPIDKSVGGQGGNGRIDIRLLQLNGKDATSDPKNLASWVTTPIPKLGLIQKQCLPPAVVPQ